MTAARHAALLLSPCLVAAVAAQKPGVSPEDVAQMSVVAAVYPHPVKGDVGESGTILASPDVITDLNSVERFVEVSAA